MKIKNKNAINARSFNARFENHTAETLFKTYNNYRSLEIARHTSPSDAQYLQINLL